MKLRWPAWSAKKWAVCLTVLGTLLVAGIAAALVYGNRWKAAAPAKLMTARECSHLNTYWEAAAAHEPDEGLRMVAWVTKGRAQDNKRYWGGETICKVVWHKRFKRRGGVVPEFSWTILKAAKRVPSNKAEWERAKAQSDLVYDGKWSPEGNLRLARYYLRPGHSARRNVCWFKKNLILVGIVGKHHFYREPITTAERTTLAQSKPAECEPLKKKEKKKKGKSAKR